MGRRESEMEELRSGSCILCIRPHEAGQETRRAPSGIGWMHVSCWKKEQLKPRPPNPREKLTRKRVRDTQPGRYFLIRASPTLGRESFTLASSPGRTNMGGTPLAYGWLGETDSVNHYAEGAIQVYKGADGRMDFREIDGHALLAESLRDEE